MEHYDISHLPPALHDAVLHLLGEIVQAFPLAPAEAVRIAHPSADTQTRFPRSATELLLLEALEAIALAPASPQQLAAMIHKPRPEVQATLTALATLGTIHHPWNGQYRHRQQGEDVQHPPPRRPRHGRLPDAGRSPGDDVRPSTRFTAQIAQLCAPSTSRGPTAEESSHEP